MQIVLALALAVLVIVSGVAMSYTKHEARRLFVELEELNREHDRLQIDWGRLQLEQSTWATHSRIEALARDRLDLALPADSDIVMIAEPRP